MDDRNQNVCSAQNLMKLADVDRMLTDTVALDTETHVTRAGLLAPPLVCSSLGWYTSHSGIEGQIFDEDATLRLVTDLLFGHEVIAGANVVFDLLVLAQRFARDGADLMPAIWRALEDDNRVFDIQIQEALDAVAEGCLGSDPRTGGQLINPETGRRGRYSLSMVVDLVLGRQDAKANDDWRRAYAQLHPFPMASWPPLARSYPIDDAKNTLEVALAQAGYLPRLSVHRWDTNGKCEWCGLNALQTIDEEGRPRACRTRRRSRNMHDLANQVGAAFAMHAGAAWGFSVNQNDVDLILADCLDGKEEAALPFKDAGFIRPDGTGNKAALARRVAAAYGASTAHPCLTCDGTGKTPSTKSKRALINCQECKATGFDLSVAPDIPRAEKGGIACGRDPLNESGDDLLIDFADFGEDMKTTTVYIPFLRRARIPIAGHDDACPQKTVEKEDCTCLGPYKDIPLTLWPDVLKETGRAAYGGVIHQFPRKGGHKNKDGQRVPSLRECIRARPGCVLSSEDFEAGELVTHAQSCLWLVGHSELANALCSGKKVHNALGATMIGLTYDEFMRREKEPKCKDARQAAKPGNFGNPGGMGPVKMVQTQRRQGPDTPHPFGPTTIVLEDGTRVRGYKGLRFCILMDGAEACGLEKRMIWNDRPIAPTCAHCIECAVRLKRAWLEQWPENTGYFQFINDVLDNGQTITAEMLELWPHLQGWFFAGQQLAPGEVMQHVSGRVRQVNTAKTDSPYCSAANGYFQALLADAAKAALRRTSRECYDHTVRIPDIIYSNSARSRYAGGPSPLYGSRVITFQHDEQILEHPESMGHDGAMRTSEIMVEELAKYCPDLAPACKAEPTLMYQWIKGAKPVWLHGGSKPANADDRLIPYQLAA